ncbi:uncharacterized protein BKA78DRAFT_162362 [Phyllosticta capitalensis]|uniref:uncharacterized protein n=1 Tax=Phyllosticta capitalensis TaxID=121624 RepID=UPI00313122F9
MLLFSKIVLLLSSSIAVTGFEYKPAPQPAGYPALPPQQCEQEPQNLPDGGIFRPAEQGPCSASTLSVCGSGKCARIAANGGTDLCLEKCEDEGPGETKCTNQGLQSWKYGCQPKAGGPSVDPWNVEYPGPFDDRVGACTTNDDFPCILTRNMNYVP